MTMGKDAQPFSPSTLEVVCPSGIYHPSPIDTSAVALPEVLARLVEILARNNHDVWAQDRIRSGWRWGAARDDRRRLHPDLRPYDDLEESEKQYDRNAAIETIKAILALGFKVER